MPLSAQAYEPINISKVADKLQLRPEEYSFYGTTKAKACCPALCSFPPSVAITVTLTVAVCHPGEAECTGPPEDRAERKVW